MASISKAKFLLFNAMGAALRAELVGSAGFHFGSLVEVVLVDVRRYEIPPTVDKERGA